MAIYIIRFDDRPTRLYIRNEDTATKVMLDLIAVGMMPRMDKIEVEAPN